MCTGAWTYTHAQSGQWLTSDGFYHSLPDVWVMVCHWTWISLIQLDVWSNTSGPQVSIAEKQYHTQVLCVCWVSELRSSRFQSKHVAHWTTLPFSLKKSNILVQLWFSSSVVMEIFDSFYVKILRNIDVRSWF